MTRKQAVVAGAGAVLAACVGLGLIALSPAAGLAETRARGTVQEVSGSQVSGSQVSGSQVSEFQASSAQAPRCLDSHNMGAVRVVGENLIIAHDSFGNPYEMELGGPCRSMSDFSHIGFEFNGGDQICRAHDAFVLYSEGNEQPLRCTINSVKSISREEADKLESNR